MLLLSSKTFKKTSQMLTMSVVLGSAAVSSVSAASVYGANPTTNQLQVIDTTANTVSTVFTNTSGPRGLVFTDPNTIVYTTQTPGTLDSYSLATHTNSVLNTFGANQLGQYVTVDPGGASVVFGIGGAGIDRFNLSTHAVTTVSTFSDPRGLAYDSTGRLFAVLGAAELAQIDPVTGTVLNSIALPSSGSAGANGLAFDPVTGELFVTDDTNTLTSRGLYEIPTNLASATLVNSGLLGNGLAADGLGNLWIAESNNLDEYNTTSHNLTTGALDPGLYDVAIAPASTVPPPPTATPEPASMLLLAMGLGTVGAFRTRLQKRSR